MIRKKTKTKTKTENGNGNNGKKQDRVDFPGGKTTAW